MSAPSDPPPHPSDETPGEPPNMTVLAALGWSLGVTFALIVLQGVLLKLKPGSTDDIVRDGLCQVAAYLGGLFLILRVHAPEASIRDYIGLRRTHVAFYVIGIVLGVAMWLPADTLLTAIEKRWPLPSEGRVAEMLFHASKPHKIAMIAVMSVFGPLIEEAFFRGALFRALRKTHPAATAIVATAGLFAMVHGAWQIVVPIGIIGVALGLLRSESGSSIPGALLHVAFNGTTCALIILSKTENGNVDVPNSFVVASAVVAVVMVLLVHFLGARSTTAALAREQDLR